MYPKSINLDISHRCTLECSRCIRAYYKQTNTKVPGHDMTLQEYMLVANHFQHINFCGNASDPVFNPLLVDFLRINKQKNISCEIHNAATGKSLAWYKKAFEANPDARWIFGIDGVPEDSSTYRINQDGEALFEAMKLCAQMGLNATWRFIVFRYNEDDIEFCKHLAKHIGVNFEIVSSSRFYENDPLKPSKHFIERDYVKHISQVP